MGVGPILWVISTTTLRQTVTPSHLLGRVSAINIVAAAAGFLVQAMVILASPVLRLARQPRLAD
jgi:hypothetical protein